MCAFKAVVGVFFIVMERVRVALVGGNEFDIILEFTPPKRRLRTVVVGDYVFIFLPSFRRVNADSIAFVTHFTDATKEAVLLGVFAPLLRTIFSNRKVLLHD